MGVSRGAYWWRLLAKALGEKAHPDKRQADQIALIRLFIFLTYMLTNLFYAIGYRQESDAVLAATKTLSTHIELISNVNS